VSSTADFMQITSNAEFKWYTWSQGFICLYAKCPINNCPHPRSPTSCKWW